MNINFLGQRNSLGGGIHFASFVDAFKKVNFLNQLVREFGLESWSNSLKSIMEDDVNIWFWYDDAIKSVKGFNIIWAIFEQDVLPKKYIQDLANNADLVWVPSEWGRSVLINCGLPANLIDVVPEGVDHTVYHSFSRKQGDEMYRFLVIGKYEQRKGYDQLIEAFTKAFKNNHNVLLMIKADWFLSDEMYNKKQNEINLKINKLNISNIKLITGHFENKQMPILYGFADGFLFPSRAEGWGLPLIEALASGLPCAAIEYSGQTEYLSRIPSKFLSIEHKLVPIEDKEFFQVWPKGDGATPSWAEADVDHLSKLMLEMVNKRHDWADKANQASLEIRTLFSWDRSVDRALSSLRSRNLLPAPKINVSI